MKRFYICMLFFAGFTYGQEQKDISTDLNLAVKQLQGGNVYVPGTPPSLFVRFGGLSWASHYTSDILDRRINMVYVDGDKLYSNTYIPIMLQQHYTNLAVDAFYRSEKMYALPDSKPNQPTRK